MIDDPEPIWNAIQDELRQAVAADLYDIWLAPLRALAVDGDVVVVEAPPELRCWVAERFARALRAAACTVLGAGATVEVRDPAPHDRFTTARGTPTRRPPPAARVHGVARGGDLVAGTANEARADPGEHLAGGRSRARVRSGERGGHAGEQAPGSDGEGGLSPMYRFEQFVIGDTNRFAHAAALAVAELPGQAYNPLFIYGPPGVGKTHLLHSIGNYMLAYGSGLSVRYATVETFTNDFLAALHRGDIDHFKATYRRSDVLLVDDVQFLASKAKTEEEFFHTFNALHDLGSQLVLTSDRLPRDLDALEDRLRERFEAGLVTAIAPPDLTTRLTVLRKRVQHDGVGLADDGVLDLVAARVPHNMRALEGALIRVVAYASLTARPLTTDLTAEVLDELYPTRAVAERVAARPTIEGIQELAAEAFGLSREDLLSTGREARVAWPRQLAMYLARELTDETLPAIGRSFGGRSHTTVMHACRRASTRLATDPEAAQVVRRLTERLGPAPRRAIPPA